GEGVITLLEVSAYEDYQEWRRDFAGQKLVTRQYLLGDGRFGERSGLVELCFRPAVIGSELHYRQEGARVCRGPLRIPVPAWFRPRVEARAGAEPGDTRMQVDIRVSMPILGTLVSYRGPVERLDGDAEPVAT